MHHCCRRSLDFMAMAVWAAVVPFVAYVVIFVFSKLLVPDYSSVVELILRTGCIVLFLLIWCLLILCVPDYGSIDWEEDEKLYQASKSHRA